MNQNEVTGLACPRAFGKIIMNEEEDFCKMAFNQMKIQIFGQETIFNLFLTRQKIDMIVIKKSF